MTRFYRSILCGVLLSNCIFSYPDLALAEKSNQVIDLSLEELVNVEVESASRFKQKSSEAPSAVEVLTAENIRNYGWRTLADALNSIRGLYIRNDRNYTYLGNRGFSRPGDYNARVLIMIDGRRMNETIFDTGFIAEEFLLDMNLIDRIEYIPGSGSSVYGANALLGVVNVVTKQGRDIDGVRVSGEAGSLDTYRGRITYGKKWQNGAELLLNGSHFNSHGNEQLFYPEFSDDNNGISQDNDQERNFRTFGKLSYGDFTLRGGYITRRKEIPTAPFFALFNQDNFSVDSQGYLDLDYLTQINADLGLEIRGFHHWYDYHSIGPYTNLDNTPVQSFEGADSRWWGGEIKLTGTQFAHHKWISGVEFQKDQRQHFVNYDISPPELYYETNNNGWRAGFYIQDEYRITGNLLLNAGARLDYHHRLKQLQLNPRIGLVWDITPVITTKLLYGSAFRAPNVLEQDLNLPDAKPLEEEHVDTYEAVAEWYPVSGLKLLGTVFYNDVHKVLSLDPVTFNTVNAGAYKTLGFEFGADKHWSNGRQVKLTWTHTSTRDKNPGHAAWANDSPSNLVKAHYAEPLFGNRLTLGFEEIFVDERRTVTGNKAPSYHLFNINMAMTKPLYGLQASLGIYNVFDQHYKIVTDDNFRQDTLAMDGRTVRFRLEYGF